MKTTLWLAGMIAVLLLGMNPAGAQTPARDAGYLYLSPVPGAPYVSVQTRYVLVRFANVIPAEVTNLTTGFITVTGANSGDHSGAAQVASDGRTMIFTMTVDFSPNELVTVTLNPQVVSGASGTVLPYQYEFMVTAPVPGTLPAPALPTPGPAVVKNLVPRSLVSGGASNGIAGGLALTAVVKSNGVSVPSDFPISVITVNSNPAPGYILVPNQGQGSHFYWMMLDNNGDPVWYRRGLGMYLDVQDNDGIAMVAPPDETAVYDQNFNYLRSYRTVNGYSVDIHEIEVLENGNYLMLGYRENQVDMSQYVVGGATNATVFETVIQEFTAVDELIFQWRAWDHYDVRDILGGLNLASVVFFAHLNALDVDEDGHLLVSSRELCEATKINRDSGDIIWRLSGNQSSFSFLNDPQNGFSFQHDISALGNGRYMVFDNGNSHVPPASRAVEYQLNFTNMTATQVWQFRDTPDKYTWVKGNAQRLPNGHTFIDFVQPGYPLIEVDTNGVKRFELNLLPASEHYRATRRPWNGVVAVPYLLLEPDSMGLNLIFNKFGDSNVSYFRIYGGLTPQPTTLLATSATTLKRLTNLQNGSRYYFRVTAVNGQGGESGYSNEETLIINVLHPGEPMIVNGDFSQGTNSWNWAVTGGAAQWQINNGVSYFDIVNGGSIVAGLQLFQAGKPLMQGMKYVFEFDAWSQGPRYIEAKVGQATAPYANYSGIGFSFVTPVPTRFRYVFTMAQASDFNSSVMFNLGGAVLDVYVDNVSLFNTPPGDFNLDGRVDFQDLAVFSGNWPKQQNGLVSDVDGNGKVDFKDFAIFGANWSGNP